MIPPRLFFCYLQQDGEARYLAALLRRRPPVQTRLLRFHGMDEIAAEFSEYAMESAGYKNLADIAYAKTDGDTIRLVFVDCEIESAFYLATRFIDESGGKTLLITWNGAEYEVNKGKAERNEELADMFPDEWEDVVNKAFSGEGVQLGTDFVDRIDGAIEGFQNK